MLVTTKEANKCGALHFAACDGRTEIGKYLLKLCVDSRDGDGETPLIIATRHRQ